MLSPLPGIMCSYFSVLSSGHLIYEKKSMNILLSYAGKIMEKELNCHKIQFIVRYASMRSYRCLQGFTGNYAVNLSFKNFWKSTFHWRGGWAGTDQKGRILFSIIEPSQEQMLLAVQTT